MKKLRLLILCIVFTIPIFSQEDVQNINQNTSNYYFIRHAEKDRSKEGIKNPHLTNIGLARAQSWANTLKHIPFDAVYSTDYFRTKETAQPIADNKRLEIIIYNPKNLDIKNFKEETKGKTVLIVGHSNTTPMFVNKLLDKQKYKQIDDTNNSNLYIINIINDTILDLLLVIDMQ